jgi:hypothetical protein
MKVKMLINKKIMEKAEALAKGDKKKLNKLVEKILKRYVRK